MPIFVTTQWASKFAPCAKVLLSAGVCELTRQAYCEPDTSSVGVEDGTVGVESMKRKVGVGVSEGGGVFEGNIVTVGVNVGGIINAV